MTHTHRSSLSTHHWPLPRLMLITDGASLAGAAGAERIAAAVRGGVGIVQLRDRGAPAGELLERARLLRAFLPETLLVVNELIKANKDFDLIMLPNRGHGFGNEPYMVRRRWDYFVRYLLGAEPPKEYELRPPAQGGPPGSAQQ